MSVTLFSLFFLILFMIHEFEEMVFLESWKHKNMKLIKMYRKFIPFNVENSLSSFIFAIFEEFLILSILILISIYTNNSLILFGVFVAYTIHLLVHIIQSAIIRKYIPAVITSVAFLPVCGYIIYVWLSTNTYSIMQLLLTIILSTLLMVINLLFIHRLMAVFDRIFTR